MKQQILNLKKKLLLVELPEWMNDVFSYTHRLQFEVKLISKLTDITESQFAEWVETWTGLMDVKGNYKDYRDSIFRLNTAKESFFSYLEKEGVVFENKLPDPELTMRQGDGSVYYGASEKDFEDYEEAESKVWVLSNCYLFEILN